MMQSVAPFTEEEMQHLIHLGQVAKCAIIISQAVKSGNIFDPVHLERARAIREEEEHGDRILTVVIEQLRGLCEEDDD